MIDITEKKVTLRRAVAEARVDLGPVAVEAIREGAVPKGSVEDVTRAAGLLGIKRTPDLLPFCHPIPVDRADVSLEIDDAGVCVRVEVAAISRTGHDHARS